tara:strand:- start:2049 stop:2345 length:297 start_codon:yes stop_codon:yes gene_type:complete
MKQPRVNLGGFVPEAGDCSPFGDITYARNAGPGVTYVEGPQGFGCHLSEAAQRNPDVAVQFSPDEAPGWTYFAPQWVGIQKARRRSKVKPPAREVAYA